MASNQSTGMQPASMDVAADMNGGLNESPRGGADMETMTELALPGVGSPLRVFPTTNMERMYAGDEAWNARDWETFDAYHDPDHVVVYWPDRQSTPTRNLPDHRAESRASAERSPTTRSSTPTTCSSVTTTVPASSRGSPEPSPHL